MKSINELSEMISDVKDKYTAMPADVENLIEILFREIIKHDENRPH